MAENKKIIKVTLEVREIVFDVMNKTHLTGVNRIAEGSKNYEVAANIQASEEEEHSYQIKRSISDAFSELKLELGEFLDEDDRAATNLIKNEIDLNGKLILSFLLPSNFNQSACNSLSAGLHEYIVSKTIAEWFLITNKDDAADYTALAVQALAQTKQALYKRCRPKRPTYGISKV